MNQESVKAVVMSINTLITQLLKGTVLYTENNTEVRFTNNQFWFGKSKLDFDKIMDVPLSIVKQGCSFPIDPVKGTHCKVWDDDPTMASYALIGKYNIGHIYPFRTLKGTGWKYAEPV